MSTEIFDGYFNTQIKTWMYSGIENTMKKNSLHLCSLALSSYTEIVGGLVTGNLREEGNSRANYEAFLPYLGEYYVNLNNRIVNSYKETLGNLHKAVRSKLVHEFSLKGSYIIVITELADENKYGIELIENKTESGFSHLQLNFYVREYYRDFKKGVEKYYNELKDWRNDNQILGNFLNATVNR